MAQHLTGQLREAQKIANDIPSDHLNNGCDEHIATALNQTAPTDIDLLDSHPTFNTLPAGAELAKKNCVHLCGVRLTLSHAFWLFYNFRKMKTGQFTCGFLLSIHFTGPFLKLSIHTYNNVRACVRASVFV